MSKLIEVVKHSQCETLKEKMVLLMNSFISARQMGEVEALYKIFPSLHLKDSNVTTQFVPTSRKENRSKMLKKIGENEDYFGREKKRIDGRDGWFVEKYDVIDKYTRRDKTENDADEISVSQYLKMYVPTGKKPKKKKENSPEDENTDSEAELESDEENKFDFVMHSGTKRILLPQLIKLDNPYPGEPHYMKKRKFPAILRFHKFKASINPEDYWFAEALLYTPFRTEEELEKRVADAAKDGYLRLSHQIQDVKSKVMEHLENTEEARFMVEEAVNNKEETGAEMDPEGEQDNEECNMEEIMLHPDFVHLNPQEFLELEKRSNKEKTYRPIELDEIDVLKEKSRKLDFFQRKVIECGIRFARRVVKAIKVKNQAPNPPKMMIHGGAGCGKSTVINVLKQWMHLILQQPGDDPDCPYVLVCAPTGTAASNIRGQTLHIAFGFSFSNQHFSLSDKQRDKKRFLLQHLKIVIVDEISMMKSDQLFQLDMRLREVTQKKDKIFGNVSLFFFGDIMQLKPCQGRYIFQPPVCEDYQLSYSLGKHWQSFGVITLEENHRQEDDHEYAEMLNRIRVGKQTEEDFKRLQDRVRPENHPDLLGAMFISCKNKEVARLNMKRLDELEGSLFVFEAVNVHPTIKDFKPMIDKKGNVNTTPFLQTLKLKIASRIMLTYNIDTLDCLTNGTRGELVAFHKNSSGIVVKMMVKFDEEHQGQQRRDTDLNLTSKYPGCTAIERVSFQYSLAKRSSAASNTAKVYQFPLSLCFAATSHKFQGQTIVKPNKAADDLRSVFQAAQTYTILSRTQSIQQVFIIGSLPESKFYADHKALQELERLEIVSCNTNPPLWEQRLLNRSFKISYLNCHSLKANFKDIEADSFLKFSHVICLSEIWQVTDKDATNFQLNGYRLHLNSAGLGKGLATYYKGEMFIHSRDVTETLFQITKLTSPTMDVISVYRSQGCNTQNLTDSLESMIDIDKSVVIGGDFNICTHDNKTNILIKTLKQHGFEEHVKQATHIKGGHIDHVYFRRSDQIDLVDVLLYSPYYLAMDHDALCVTALHRN